MKTAITLVFASLASGIAATLAAAAPLANDHPSRAAEVATLMQTWQSRILASGLPVDDAKNWARRNMAKFSRLDGERLSLAQRAPTLGELELALVEAPVPTGTHLDVLMATNPSDISMLAHPAVTKLTPATSPSSYSNLVFNAVAPCRMLDSRPSQGGAGQWLAGSSRIIKIGPYATGYQTGPGAQGGSSTSCGLDSLAGPGQIAVIMAAVSTVSQAGAGYLTFYPNGGANPGVNSVSQWYQPGFVQTAFVLIPSDLLGNVTALGFTSATTDVIIDVVGYFVAAAGNGNITLVQSTAVAGNIMKGGTPFLHNFGSSNTFVGVGAGNLTMTGTSNVGSGSNALAGNTTGGGNTASGVFALASNTTGGNNTANGFSALTNSTTGNGNTAIGDNTLNANTVGGANTAVGSSALANTTANNNTGIGTTALFANTTGTNNTGIGNTALFANTTGSNNTAVGNNAGSARTTGSFNIDIGNAGVAAEGNTIRIGDVNQTKTFISGIRGVTTGSVSAIPVLIDSNGQLGTVSSSRRFKDDIADMDTATSALMKLRPVTFHYKADRNPSGRTLQYGLIAEEVAEVYPGLVAHSADGQVETVMYQFLPSMLLNEYQRQERRIDLQARDSLAYRERIARLELDGEHDRAALKAALAQIGELQQATAHLASMLQQQRNGALAAGLDLK